MNFSYPHGRGIILTVIIGIGFLFIFYMVYTRISISSSTSYISLKSSCRGLVSKKIKKSSRLTRIKQLNQLTEIPLDWVFEDQYEQVIDTYCYRGKKQILINLWATWCPPCIEELSSLSRLADQSEKNLVVIAITTEPKEIMESFLKKSFSDLSPQLKIVRLSEQEVRQYFPEDSLPVTYLFDKHGQLKNKFLGAREWDLDLKFLF